VCRNATSDELTCEAHWKPCFLRLTKILKKLELQSQTPYMWLISKYIDCSDDRHATDEMNI
jgi:hypothetical protein